MNSLFGIFTTSLFYVFVGWPLTYMLGKISKIERVGIAFLLGNGLSTFVWFLLYQTGREFNLFTLFISGLIVFIVSRLINRLCGFKYQNLVEVKPKGLNLKLCYLIIALLLTSFLIASYNPISGWDAITLYDFRGHTIALNHSLKDLLNNSYYMSYPLMVSLDHAAIYMLGGISAQGLHSIFFMSFIAVIYGRMSQWTNQRFSLLTVLFIILNEEIFSHSTVAYVNLSYLVYLVAGILYIVSPSSKLKELGYLFIGGLLTAVTTWIRSDVPFWMLGTLLTLIQGFIIHAKALSLFSIYLTYMMRHTWLKFYTDILVSLKQRNEGLSNPITLNALRSVPGDMPDAETIQKIGNNLPSISWYLYINVFSPYRGLWLLAIPLTIIAIKKKNLRLMLLTLTIIISAAMVTYGVMLFSTSYSTWDQIGGSARRMMLFVVPLIIVTAIYSLYIIKQDKHNAH